MQGLRQRIAAHQPRAVIFYGLGYRDYWAAIAGAALQPALGDEMLVHAGADRLFVAMKHPVATGVTSDYFYAVGQYIRAAL